MSETDFPLPPPTFEFLVFSLKTQAEMQLGLFGLGGKQEGAPDQPNFAAARHAIDLLTMISEKMKGNLSIEEQRLIENSLTELRFRFVQVSDQTKVPAASTGAGSANSGGAEEAKKSEEAASSS
jgi:Domain of unknown function (DUF1844)